MTSQVSPVPTLPRFQREHTGYPSIKNSKVPPAGFEPTTSGLGSSPEPMGMAGRQKLQRISQTGITSTGRSDSGSRNFLNFTRFLTDFDRFSDNL